LPNMYINLDDVFNSFGSRFVSFDMVSNALTHSMANLDDIKNSIPDNAYLSLSNNMRIMFDYAQNNNIQQQNIQQNVRQASWETINMISADIISIIEWLFLHAPYHQLWCLLLVLLLQHCIIALMILRSIFPALKKITDYFSKVCCCILIDTGIMIMRSDHMDATQTVVVNSIIRMRNEFILR